MKQKERARMMRRLPDCALGNAEESPAIPPRPQAVRGPTTGLCKNIGVDATMAKCGFSMADLMISQARIEKVKNAQVNSGDVVAALNTTIVNANRLINRKPLHDNIRKEANKLSKHVTTVRNRLQKKDGIVPQGDLPELRKEFVKIRRKVEKLNKAVSAYCGNGAEMSARTPRVKPRKKR